MRNGSEGTGMQSRTTARSVVQENATIRSPAPGGVSLPAPSTSASATNNDIDEFLARARAMGLNLSRQDYERARAGVSAFLRAERVSAASAPSSTTSTTAAAGNGATEEANGKAESSKESSISTVGKDDHPTTRRTTSTLPRAPSSAQTTLSFFTAVLPSQDANANSRPRLDEIGSLEERRRRREKRRRLREKAEREATDADCESGSHRCRKAVSEPIEESPLTSIGAEDTPILSGDRSPGGRALRMKSTSLNMDALARVGLGIMGETSPSQAADDRFDALQRSPRKILAASQNRLHSPALSKLTRKAHIDVTGRLLLLPSPVKDDERSTMAAVDRIMEYSMASLEMSGLDDEMVAANAGGETDDSGVCFTGESISVKKDSQPTHNHRRRVSSLDSSSNDLNDSMGNLSFFERVMAQKKSPLRLRKEAKARERQARLAAANNDLVVMTATTSMPQHPNPSSVPANASTSAQQFLSGNDGKSVRWAADLSSPRKRLTTKEMYDFEFYGIAPSQPHANMNLSWDGSELDLARRATASRDPLMREDENGHQRMRSHFSSTSFGSPIAVRSAQNMVSDSPGMLSLALNENSFHNAALGSQLLAKRGLLFGSTPDASHDGMTTPSSTLDGALGDMTNVFSQGPTLARSPARKGLIETETPPRLLRANTLAAPISLAHAVFGREDGKPSANEGSPERGTLTRAHSSSVLEGHARLLGRHSSGVTRTSDDKENCDPNKIVNTGKRAPIGWADRSGADSFETISPAAIFGMQQSQQQQRQLQQPKQRLRMTSTGSTSDADRRHDRHHSISEAEGDDERNPSPLTAFKLRTNGPSKGKSGHGRDSSTSTLSAYDDSPLMLDTRSNKATVVSRPTSGNSLAKALDMPSRHEQADGGQASDSKRSNRDGTSHLVGGPTGAFDQLGAGLLSAQTSQMVQTLEWDKPDGSRVVKLVSEELQAALESGTLAVEPPSRFYKLPPGWGRSKAKPQSVSYAGMIGQAILSSSDGRLSLNEIYNWISCVFPFFERGDRGWQNSIRHNLSLNKSFMKVERESNIPGKGGWWAIKHGHEDRFRAGNYFAPGTAKAAKEGGVKTPKTSTANLPSSESSTGAPSEPMSCDVHSSGQSALHPHHARRKRIDSDHSASEAASDSDSLPPSNVKKGRKRPKKVKLVSRSARNDDKHSGQAQQEGEQAIPVTLMRPSDGLMNSQSMLSPSPKHFSTITPSRPYQPRTMGTSSSDFGSAYASSVMAGMPVLTDASSPPSSPNNPMPPPPGGIRGAASSQSAQKQRDMHQQSSQAMTSMYGGLTPFGLHLGSYSQHSMPASPLANMRGNVSGAINTSSRMRNGVNLAANVDSPLRPSDASPTRMSVNSPVSNVRDTYMSDSTGRIEEQSADKNGPQAKVHLVKSPARFLHHSPLRGSPLRPGGPMNQGMQSSMMLSPAGMHLQMALGQQQPGQHSGQSGSHTGPSTLLTYGLSTPTTQRWGMATPSPSRRTDGIYSPGHPFLTPNAHGNMAATGLDDPFDYSGHLQHELDMASELHLTGQGEPSPMKGFENHAFGSRSGIAHTLNFGTSLPNPPNGSSASTDSSNNVSSYNPFLPQA